MPQTGYTNCQLTYSECYFCAELTGVWCKICQESFCPKCHQEQEENWHKSEYQSPHQWYNRELECNKNQLWYHAPNWLSDSVEVFDSEPNDDWEVEETNKVLESKQQEGDSV